ncbi:MAG: glycosyltransferase [Bacteroidota bacterium]
MTKIKVAHIALSTTGVDVSVRLIIGNIDNNIFENIVIHGLFDTQKPFLDVSGQPVADYRLPLYRDIKPLSDFKSILKAYRIVKKEKPDLIHCHSAKGGIIGRVVAKLTGTPVLFTPQAFSYLSTTSKVKRAIFLGIEKLFVKGSTLLASSPSEMERGTKEVGFNDKNAILFNNSILPIDTIHPLTIPKTWPDSYICTIGRPGYQKNLELMLHAVNEVKKHRDIHLVLLGVGKEQGQVEGLLHIINTLGIKDNVTMVAWTERENTFNIVKAAQLYISTARYEGLPYAIIESLALGKPSVVSNCDGNKDLVSNEYNGFVIATENPVDYAEKILELLNNKELQDSFSANSKTKFEASYNLNKTIKDLQDIYWDVKKNSGII